MYLFTVATSQFAQHSSTGHIRSVKVITDRHPNIFHIFRASLKAKGSDMVIPEPPEELEVDP